MISTKKFPTVLLSFFLIIAISACTGSQYSANQKQYKTSMDKMITATNKAISDAGLNVKGSLYRDDGSFLITAVELTNQFGSEEPVQTMSIDIVLDRVDDETVMVEIESPNRRQYVMAGNNQTAESKFRERIFNSLEDSVGSINSE